MISLSLSLSFKRVLFLKSLGPFCCLLSLSLSLISISPLLLSPLISLPSLLDIDKNTVIAIIIFFSQFASSLFDPMTPNYHSTLTPFPLEFKEDHQLIINQQQLFNLNQAPAPSASSSSSPAASCHSFFEPVQEKRGCYHIEPHQLQPWSEAKVFVSQAAGSCDHPTVLMNESSDSAGLKLSIWKKDQERNIENQSESSSVKWMSSKMRFMKKVMNSDAAAYTPNSICMQKLEDQKQPSSSSLETDNNSCNNSYSNNTNTNTIRVCADCNTTKTPLWRSGPRGPKSLCNACGIRQRKARQAMAAAAAAANGTILAADTSSSKKNKMQNKDKTLMSNNSCLPFKKRRKFASPSGGKSKNQLCFEDLSIILSKNSAYQRVFPQDEKEAAILLMALSYGLVQG